MSYQDIENLEFSQKTIPFLLYVCDKELEHLLDLYHNNSEDYDENDYIIWENFIRPELNNSIDKGLKISDMLDKGVSFLLQNIDKHINIETSIDMEIKNELQSILDLYHL